MGGHKIHIISCCPGKPDKQWLMEGGKRKLFHLNLFSQRVEIFYNYINTYDEEFINVVHKMGFNEIIEINSKNNLYIFQIESTGAIEITEIIKNTFNHLRRDFGLLKSKLLIDYKSN